MTKAPPMREVTESVSMPFAGPAKMHVRAWTIEVLAGPDKGKKVSTLEGLIRVGSDPSNDLVLSDTTVSRRHLEIERVPKGLLLRDLSSRNGTWLDGRHTLQAMVEPGDKISLGKTKLVIKQQTRGTEIELAGGETFGDLVGASEMMRAIFSELRRVAKDEMNVLIEGETGSGKELAARAVHQHSIRRHGPFRVVDCSLVRDDNFDKDFFGPEGHFASAAGGTLFFDEITELPLSVQPRLLRVIETREVPGMAGAKPRQLTARLVASTHKNLEEEVQQDRFRKDLFYRLAVARIRVPPLRVRKTDIPVLCRYLLRGLGTPFEISAQTLSMFEGYDWPGNVRELRNVLERGALMQQTGNTNWLDFMAQPPPGKKTGGTQTVAHLAASLPYHEAKDRVLAEFERQYFAEIMKDCNFDIKLAEERTGLSMQSLYRLLKKNGLRLKDLKNAEGLS